MGDRTFSHVITVEDPTTPVLDDLLAEHPEFAAVLPPEREAHGVPVGTVWTRDPHWPGDEDPAATTGETEAAEGGDGDA